MGRGLMRCEDVLVPREHLIGPGGPGFTQVMELIISRESAGREYAP
ncbi:hypothetical protein [Kocuria sp.]|nr:hypothetical protein [Kocuria sp.]